MRFSRRRTLRGLVTFVIAVWALFARFDHLDRRGTVQFVTVVCECRNQCQVNSAKIRDDTAHTAVDRVKDAFEAIPDLADKLLPHIEHFKADQPAHDEMGDDEEAQHAKKQKQGFWFW